MKWEEFSYIFFYQSFYLISSIFLILLIIMYISFKKNIYSIFDPLNMMLISLSACYSVVFYLKITNRISDSAFLELFAINIVFLISFKYFINKNKKKISKRLKYSKFKIYYYYHSILFILLAIIFAKSIGLNIFVNKFSVFSNLGILNYLRRALFPGQLILLLIKRELYGVKSRKDIIIMIILLLLFFFSGGKTSTLTYVMYFYSSYYIFYRSKISKKIIILKKYEKFIMIFSFIGIIFLIQIIHKENNLLEILKRLIFRIISFGDTYYMIYPKEFYKKLNIPNLREYYLYRLILPILRRVGYDGNALGFEIVEKLYNIKKSWTGPNTRADIILQLNWGYFGVIISVFNGFLMSFFRNIKTKNYIILYILINLFVISETLIIDFSIFAMSIFGIGLVLIPGIFIVEGIYILKKY